jgi:uncharacterized protein DUF2806
MAGSKLPTTTSSYGSALDKLADTVRHVVDLAAGPERLRAKAQAEADTEVILARGRTEAQDIEVRAVDRIRRREVRRQQNIEAITVEAGYALPPPDEVSSKPVEEDWTSRFFEECKDISNSEMQTLWARILAREVTRPGSFSPRTLTIVRDLTRDDAKLFSQLCSFIWEIDDTGSVLVLHEVTVDTGLNFAMLTHLSSIGLVQFHNLSGFLLRDRHDIRVRYFGRTISLTAAANREFDVGRAMLTLVGHELCGICGAQPDEPYRLTTIERWKEQGWTVSPLDEDVCKRTRALAIASG